LLVGFLAALGGPSFSQESFPLNRSFARSFALGAVVLTTVPVVSIASIAEAAAQQQTPAAAAPTQPVIQQVVEKVKPSLVRIHVVEGYPDDGREAKQESFGSGVIISPDGYVVTNHHVAGKARWLSVTLANRERVEAKLVGTDPLSDIALIKLAPMPGGGAYPAAAWGDSSLLRVGDPVLAMGSPRAFSQSVTAGIVSNTELILPATYRGDLTLDGEDVGSIVRWIGHDAPIQPGNSGGPLVNLQGEIVGINEIEVGLSGAIPGNLARAISEQLAKNGKVVRAYTGMNLQPRLRRNGDAAAASGSSTATGALVSGVIPTRPRPGPASSPAICCSRRARPVST
jgi:serine protease Do